MKRAAIIIAGPAEGNVACHVWVAAGDGSDTYLTVHPSERLLADLRTLAALPDLLAAEFAPGLTSVTLTTEVGTLLAAQEAADRVRARLGDNDAPRT